MNIDFEELHVFDKSLSKYVPREMLEKAEAESADRTALLIRCVKKLAVIDNMQPELLLDELIDEVVKELWSPMEELDDEKTSKDTIRFPE